MFDRKTSRCTLEYKLVHTIGIYYSNEMVQRQDLRASSLFYEKNEQYSFARLAGRCTGAATIPDIASSGRMWVLDG
jgi:hypothetical protein